VFFEGLSIVKIFEIILSTPQQTLNKTASLVTSFSCAFLCKWERCLKFNKIKSKGCPRAHQEGMWKEEVELHSLLTSVLDEGPVPVAARSKA
jgi:hypothetical protein